MGYGRYKKKEREKSRNEKENVEMKFYNKSNEEILHEYCIKNYNWNENKKCGEKRKVKEEEDD